MSCCLQGGCTMHPACDGRVVKCRLKWRSTGKGKVARGDPIPCRPGSPGNGAAGSQLSSTGCVGSPSGNTSGPSTLPQAQWVPCMGWLALAPFASADSGMRSTPSHRGASWVGARASSALVLPAPLCTSSRMCRGEVQLSQVAAKSQL